MHTYFATLALQIVDIYAHEQLNIEQLLEKRITSDCVNVLISISYNNNGYRHAPLLY